MKLYLKILLTGYMVLTLSSCKKGDSVPITPITPTTENMLGDWTLVSVLYSAVEYMNYVSLFYDGTMTTSCYTEIAYTDYQSLVGATFDFATATTFKSENVWCYKNHDYNSTFDSCVVIYFPNDTASGGVMTGTWELAEDGKTFTVTWVYHISPGGTAMYATNTFSIIEFDEHTLKFTGIGPYLFYLYSLGTCTYTFTR